MKKKRLLSMALAVTMLFSSTAVLPQNAFTDISNISVRAEVSTDTSGKCGENVSWSLSDDGVLTISGKGDMTDYYYGANPFYHRSDIKSVIIKSGVTSIGDYLFANCYSLTSVTMPSSVICIGESAFEECDSLINIVFPESVNSIGVYALSGTKWLDKQRKLDPLVVVNGILIDGKQCSEKVNIPSSVKIINDAAFHKCTSLTSITIPNSVTIIGDFPFYGCTNLKSVTIPSSVTSIGALAFEDCTSLTSVTIPSSVKSIGGEAFSNTK